MMVRWNVDVDKQRKIVQKYTGAMISPDNIVKMLEELGE